MRSPLVFAPLALALGLAAYWAASPGREPLEREPALEPAASAAAGAFADVAQRDRAPGSARDASARGALSSTTARDAASGANADREASRDAYGDVERRAEAGVPLDVLSAEETTRFFEDSTQPPLDSPDDRVQRLIAAGFDAARAQAIVQAESAHRAAAAYEQYRRSGTVHALGASSGAAPANALRDEIGDEDYERYLAALGEPTRVVVRDLEPDSPAAHAGVLPGDEIRSYDGRRVFNAGELAAFAPERDIGQTVAATIVRDGQELTLYLGGGDPGIAPR